MQKICAHVRLMHLRAKIDKRILCMHKVLMGTLHCWEPFCVVLFMWSGFVRRRSFAGEFETIWACTQTHRAYICIKKMRRIFHFTPICGICIYMHVLFIVKCAVCFCSQSQPPHDRLISLVYRFSTKISYFFHSSIPFSNIQHLKIYYLLAGIRARSQPRYTPIIFRMKHEYHGQHKRQIKIFVSCRKSNDYYMGEKCNTSINWDNPMVSFCSLFCSYFLHRFFGWVHHSS